MDRWWNSAMTNSNGVRLNRPRLLGVNQGVEWQSGGISVWPVLDMNITFPSLTPIFLFVTLQVSWKIFLNWKNIRRWPFAIPYPCKLWLCIHPSVYIYIYLYISVCLSVCLSICLSVCLSIYLSIYLSVYLSFCLSMHLHLSIFLRFVLPTPYPTRTQTPLIPKHIIITNCHQQLLGIHFACCFYHCDPLTTSVNAARIIALQL
jgi:hypothetical protein